MPYFDRQFIQIYLKTEQQAESVTKTNQIIDSINAVFKNIKAVESIAKIRHIIDSIKAVESVAKTSHTIDGINAVFDSIKLVLFKFYNFKAVPVSVPVAVAVSFSFSVVCCMRHKLYT